MSVIALNENNFNDEVMNSSTPVIVDFYADWCGPCQMMSPVIDKIAEELGETAKVGKVNSDSNMNLAEKYGIMSIPTIMVFKNGELVKTFVGVTSKSEIIDAVK